MSLPLLQALLSTGFRGRFTPSSDRASENAILIPAPKAVASPTRNAVLLFWVAIAAADSGANDETVPSINPARPGCTTCSINLLLSSSGLFFMF
jgi:hypothetical protein